MKKVYLKFVLAGLLVCLVVFPCFSLNREYYILPEKLESEDYSFEGLFLYNWDEEPIEIMTLEPGRFYDKGTSDDVFHRLPGDSFTVVEKATGKKLTYNYRDIYKYELENIHDTDTKEGYGFEINIAFFPAEGYVDAVLMNDDYAVKPRGCYSHLIRFNFKKNRVEVINSLDFSKSFKGLFGDFNHDYLGTYNLYKTLLTGKLCFETDVPKKYVYDSPFENIIAKDVDIKETLGDISVKGNVVYTKNNSKKFDYDIWDCFIGNCSYKTKSELKEGSTVYYASNLGKDSNNPWVCGLKDFKDEEIVINSPNMKICYIGVCNGFKREGKEYLFKNNSRPKEIEIIYDNNFGMRHIVQLNDSPEIQMIPLLNCGCKSIKIKILSVYKGEKYNDVCVNAIIPVSDIQPNNAASER